MKRVDIYAISKKDDKSYNEIINDFTKRTKKYCQISIYNIFNKKINQAQNSSEIQAKKSYTEALTPYIKSGYNIALDPNGKEVDSFEFSKILDVEKKINFYIGGAFGFEEDFIKKCDVAISLSRLTMSHKIAKIVLLEQIFRGFTILKGHPYHK